VAVLYFFHTCQKNTVFYSKICDDENVNNPAEETMLSAWWLCESYEYSVCCISHVQMRWEHGSTSSAFLQLYLSELADMLHVFNIECKHGGNITFLTFVR